MGDSGAVVYIGTQVAQFTFVTYRRVERLTWCAPGLKGTRGARDAHGTLDTTVSSMRCVIDIGALFELHNISSRVRI